MAQAIIAYTESGRSDRFLVKILDYWKDEPIRSITGEAIRLSAIKLYPDASNETRNRQVITPTKAVINYAAALGWGSPIKVKKLHHEAKEKAPATLAWVNAFATQATKDGLPQIAALCLFMFGTAARVSEALRMKWCDVDLVKGTATLHGFKPKAWSRVAHLPSPIIEALGRLPGGHNPEALIFGYVNRSSINKTWPNIVTRAGIEPLTPHCCRHGFATTMLQAQIDVATIAKRGGWKDAATVLRVYAHALEDTTITDVLFDTPPTQNQGVELLSIEKERKKKA